MAEPVQNPAPQTNPPDPQVPAPAAAATGAPSTAPATVTNPPDPQAPANGSLRIDITTGPPGVNEDVDPTLAPPGTGTIQPVQLEPAPQVVEVQATGPGQVSSGTGITGPVDGISPYGEEDEPFEPTPTTTPAAQPAPVSPAPAITGTGITGPVDGISPYGEADEPLDQGPGGAGTEGTGITGPVDGISPYGEEDEPLDLPTEQAPGVDPYDRDFDTVEPDPFDRDFDTLDGEQQQVTLAAARQQQVLRDQQKQVNQGDWRVKLRLAPGATYLYDDPSGPGILAPLSTASGTGGVIFPYTPQIQFSYNANYSSYDLTHSNYRGYFYQGSYVSDIQLQATFTAQDSKEAGYLLAVIHFFRSVTKMFYGANDAFAGTPPPLVFLEGFGEYQFNRHPMVVSQFNYVLPDDVDYIRANSPNISSTNIQYKRDLQTQPWYLPSTASQRLRNALLPAGAINSTPPPAPTFGINSPTYVPTSINISLILLPMQTRQQVSQNFNLKSFANGQLIKGGFW